MSRRHVAGAWRTIPTPVLLTITAGAVVASAVVAVGLGPVAVDASTAYGVLLEHLTGAEPGPDVPYATREIIVGIRLPRVLLAVIAGVGLSACGVVLQALLRNPLADPYLIGVSSGATFGVVTVLAVPSLAAMTLSVQAAAFVGGMIAFAGVFLVAQRGGQLPSLRLVLSGVGLAALFTALSHWIILTAPDNGALRSALTWMLGSLTGSTATQLVAPGVTVVVCVAAFVGSSRWLDALALGEEAAGTLGLHVGALRVSLVVAVALTVGMVVSVTGAVGFVALVVPHAVRLLVGTAHRRLLPMAAGCGALFLIWADVLARVVRPGQEVPLGVVTAALGAPVFLTILRRST